MRLQSSTARHTRTAATRRDDQSAERRSPSVLHINSSNGTAVETKQKRQARCGDLHLCAALFIAYHSDNPNARHRRSSGASVHRAATDRPFSAPSPLESTTAVPDYANPRPRLVRAEFPSHGERHAGRARPALASPGCQEEAMRLRFAGQVHNMTSMR